MHSNGPGVEPKSLQEAQHQFNELLHRLNIPLSLTPTENLARLRQLPWKTKNEWYFWQNCNLLAFRQSFQEAGYTRNANRYVFPKVRPIEEQNPLPVSSGKSCIAISCCGRAEFS
jgi:hypothetical protein